MPVIGIRKENKSKYERRAALAPEHVDAAHRTEGIDFLVEPSAVRIHDDSAYVAAGATLSSDLSGADLIMGVKEIPIPLLEAGQS